MSAKRLHFGLFTGLLQILRRNWPESLVGKGLRTNSISKMVAGLFKVHNMVKFLQANPSAGFNIWVDNWPSPSAVLCKADQDKCMFKCWRSYITVFATDQTALTKLMLDVVTPNLSDNRTILLHGLSTETAKTIQHTFPNCMFHDSELQMMWLRSDDNLKNDLRLPPGFKRGHMTRNAAELLVQNMQNGWTSFSDTESVYKSSTQLQCPSIVIYNENDNTVGWYVKHCLLGFTSHLYVDEKYRGRGIGKYLVSSLSQSVFLHDDVVFCQISRKNQLSMKLHKDLGFENAGTVVYCVLKLKSF